MILLKRSREKKKTTAHKFVPKKGNIIFFREKREIHLTGQITIETAVWFLKFIVQLNDDSVGVPVTVVLKSGGGDVFASLAIYAILKESVAPVRTLIKKAYSGAFIISQGGQERFITYSGSLEFHETIMAMYKNESGGAKDFLREYIFLSIINKKLYKIVGKRSSISDKKVCKFFEEKRRLNAKEALKYNLVDSIISHQRLRKINKGLIQ